ncbi:MAG: site-2 protease family protein [Acidobacteriota bacterium]
MTLTTIRGIPLQVDLGWVLMVVLMTWFLAGSILDPADPRLSAAGRWLLAAATAVAFFGSILFHELAHALVARLFGIPIRSIRLHLLGGLAEMEAEPATPKAEALIALAGPVANGLLTLLFGGLAFAVAVGSGPGVLGHVLMILAALNACLAVFNLVPGLPLDGGRVLRAAAWHYWGDAGRALRLACHAGSVFALSLLLYGVVGTVRGDFAALFWILVGVYLFRASRLPLRQHVIRQALHGLTVELLARPAEILPRGLPVSDFLREHASDEDDHRGHPVGDEGRVLGLVSVADLRRVPRDDWDRRSLGELARPLTSRNCTQETASIEEALHRMASSRVTSLLVPGDPPRILSLRDIHERVVQASQPVAS